MNIAKQESDLFGAIASALCLIHCIITPFLFIAHSCSASCAASPTWWKALNYLFLGIALVAIYYTNKNISKQWVKTSFYVCWVLLLFVILNETQGFVSIPEWVNYIPPVALIGLHLYSRKYCNCEAEHCAQ